MEFRAGITHGNSLFLGMEYLIKVSLHSVLTKPFHTFDLTGIKLASPPIPPVFEWLGFDRFHIRSALRALRLGLRWRSHRRFRGRFFRRAGGEKDSDYHEEQGSANHDNFASKG